MMGIGYLLATCLSVLTWVWFNQNKIFTDDFMKPRRTLSIYGITMFGVFMAIAALFLPCFGDLLLAVRQIKHVTLTTIMFSILMGTGAGVCEEIIFRGYLFNWFLHLYRKHKYPLLLTGLSVAFVFGGLHLINLSHQTYLATFTQVFQVVYIGVLLSILRIYFNSIYVGMAYHVLLDCSSILVTKGSVNNPSAGKLLPALIVISLIFIGLYSLCLKGLDNQVRSKLHNERIWSI